MVLYLCCFVLFCFYFFMITFPWESEEDNIYIYIYIYIYVPVYKLQAIKVFNIIMIWLYIKACKHGIGLVDLSLIQDDQSKSLFNVINQEPDLLSKGQQLLESFFFFFSFFSSFFLTPHFYFYFNVGVVIRCSTDNDASTSSNLTSSPVSLNLDETFSAELNFNCLPDPHEIESVV